ncbi:MAG TPA: hypothetical protein VFX28_18105, partial [Methylomirabilota bacterium]|nr:hypothetical protein [Methylomirabilota bacterium]
MLLLVGALLVTAFVAAPIEFGPAGTPPAIAPEVRAEVARGRARVLVEVRVEDAAGGPEARRRAIGEARTSRPGVAGGEARAAAFASMARRTSCSWMRPSGPLPVSASSTTPFSSASRRAIGVARTRPGSIVAVAADGTGNGALVAAKAAVFPPWDSTAAASCDGSSSPAAKMAPTTSPGFSVVSGATSWRRTPSPS